MYRDRAHGWQHAKISGHKNEDSIFALISNDKDIQDRIIKCSGQNGSNYSDLIAGGINEKKVESVIGAKTTPKTDIKVLLDDKIVNISLKKSLSGQVFLITIDRFIEGFEKQYKKEIPTNVKQAISLFWGSSNEVDTIIKKYSYDHKEYELRKHRIVADTLKEYDFKLYNDLLEWFGDNMSEIFDFCFSKGLAKDKKDWANIIWYKNQLEENDIDEMFNIKEIQLLIPNIAEYGTSNGGTTIQLPFGFVQWHSPSKKIPGQMQFHHSYSKLKSFKLY